MAQSPEDNAGTSEVIRYDLGWNAINALLRSGRSLSGHERNCCFLNTGNAQFANVSAATGLDWEDDGRVLALTDWDYDGDVDFWVANRSGPQLRYLRNNHAAQNHFVALWLEGRQGNRNAIGARITLRWNGQEQVQTHTVRAGDGYLSQSSRWIRFGIGPVTSIDEIQIRWPHGEEQSYRNVSADRWYKLIEGEPQPTAWSPPQWPALSPSPFEAPSVTDRARIVLLNPVPLPELSYLSENHFTQSAQDGIAKLRLINLWATWCLPCLEELSEWQQHEEELSDAGLEIVAVNVDEKNLSFDSPARALAQEEGWPFTLAYGDADLVSRLDTIQRSLLSRQRPLPVPASFLLDSEGRLRVVYKGPVSAETLLEDAKLFGATPEQTLQAALPFSGQWQVEPGGSTPLHLALKLVEGNDSDLALTYAEDVIETHQGDPQTVSADLWNLVGALRLDREQFSKAATAFAQALRLDANNRQAHIELGVLLLRAGQGVQAEEHFRKVLVATPDDSEQKYNLAVAFLVQAKFAPAEEILQEVVAVRPRALTWWQLGNARAGLGKAASAIEAYEQALKLDPEMIGLANNLAWLLATSSDGVRNGARALEVAQQIVAGSEQPTASQLDTLAASHAAAGDFGQAQLVANQAITVARSAGDEQLATRIESRLELYRQNVAFVDKAQ